MMIEKCEAWLLQNAFPTWLRKGLDKQYGGFFETLSLDGEPLMIAKRTMVQARQIYSARLAFEMLRGSAADEARQAAKWGSDFLLKTGSLESGGFRKSVSVEGEPADNLEDLYTQAFALFGMAQAYALFSDPDIKARALQLLRYLERERRLPEGGYSELKDGEVLREANPHMHLFEAAVTWLEIDAASEWRRLADELFALCQDKFIVDGALCEHFSSGWQPCRDGGKFVYEPGHQYEWAWLLGRYEKASGVATGALRSRLFELSEQHGIERGRRAVVDEMWSDHKVKAATSRFWPQCERIKAAVQLGAEAAASEKPRFAQAADDAMDVLFRFLDLPRRGLWYDTWKEDGSFVEQPAKASSLYHIAGAMTEYIRLRAKC